MADLCCDKEHCRRVFASGNASSATDTSSRIECAIRLILGNRERRRFRSRTGIHADITASLNNAVKSGTVHDTVLDDRECRSAPRFNDDRIAILELAHMKLASCNGMIGTVRHTVDDQGAHSANTFTAIVVKSKAFLALFHFPVVYDVKHFKERHIRRNAVNFYRFKLTFCIGVLLTPDFESQMHIIAHYL